MPSQRSRLTTVIFFLLFVIFLYHICHGCTVSIAVTTIFPGHCTVVHELFCFALMPNKRCSNVVVKMESYEVHMYIKGEVWLFRTSG